MELFLLCSQLEINELLDGFGGDAGHGPAVHVDGGGAIDTDCYALFVTIVDYFLCFAETPCTP